MSTVFAKIQIRRGTAAEWRDANPILSQGEFAFETDTGITKVGDGATAYLLLPAYATYDQMLTAQQAIEAAQADVAAFGPLLTAAEAAAQTASSKATQATEARDTAITRAETAEVKASQADQSAINAAASATAAAGSADAASASASASQTSAQAATEAAATATTKADEAAGFRDEAAASATAAETSADRVDLGALDAAVAATQADAVQTGEDRAAAAASAEAAEVSRVYADASATSARSARDAAFVNAMIYDTTADGLAATAPGDQFAVVSGLELIRYRHRNDGTALELFRYPSVGIYNNIIALVGDIDTLLDDINGEVI
jgi:hypothetical protein